MSVAPAYVINCILNGAIFVSLVALAIVPLVARPATGIIMRHLAAMENDPLWQAPLAAIAGALPGMLFLGIAAGGLVTGWRSPCMAFLAGRVLYGIVALVTVVSVWRALLTFIRELSYIRHLRIAARPASARLTAIGLRTKIDVREIEAPDALFALVGVFRPVAIVSSPLLARMSDDQIYAALRHEAAHRDRQDALVALILLFFSRVLPARAQFADLYYRAREVAADHVATERCGRFDLAGAITAMARTRCARVPALSGAGTVEARVHRLIENQPNVADVTSRSAAVLLLLWYAALGFAPLATEALRLFSCTGLSSR